MSIVAPEYRKTKSEINELLNTLEDITPEVLLMIDYAYHNTDSDYDDGLSFLDRLHRKLSKYFPLQWNVNNLKSWIRNSENPSTTLVDILNEILTENMVICYGV